MIDLQLKKVDNYVKNGETKLAKKLLEDILLEFPQNIRIREKLKNLLEGSNTQKQLNKNILEEINRIKVCLQEKKIDLALKDAQKLLAEIPNDAIVLKVNAMANFEKGNILEAIQLYTKSININPNDFESLSCIGLSYANIGDIKNAIKFYTKSIIINPKSTAVLNNLGIIYNNIGNFDLSIKYLSKAIELSPKNSIFYQNIGVTYRDKFLIEEAKENFLKSIELDQNNLDAYNNFGILYRNIGDYENAILTFEKAIAIGQDSSDIFLNYGTILSEVGEHDKAISWIEKSLNINPKDNVAISNLMLITNYSYSYSNNQIFYFHKKYGEYLSNLYKDKVKNFNEIINLNIATNKKLKIGFVSGDLHNHSVSCFFEPLLKSINKEEFEIFCYYNALINDERTERIKKLSNYWRDIPHLHDDKIFEIIRNDDLDLLIDISGHTDKNRLSVFAMRPTKKQATWLGYPNTTGINTINYRIVDKFTDLEKNEIFNIEKLYKLDTPFLCYEGDQNIELEKNIPFLKNKFITFGSFNNLSKLSDELIALWSKILLRVPDSKLILKNKQLNSEFMKNFYSKKFSMYGISKDRVILLGWVKGKKSHLEVYNDIDIALDTYPYHGTTTTFEALWMGVPVITLVGERHSNRVGFTILKNLNLDKLITFTEDEYVNCAVDFSKKINDLKEFKKSLRLNLIKSDLCDKDLHARNMEKCFKDIISS